MFDWVKVRRRVGQDIEEVDKAIPHYNYALKGRARKTDENVRELVRKELARARESLFSMVELAYKEEEKEIAGGLEGVRDEIDLLLDEVKDRVLLWNEKLSDDQMERIVRSDVALVRNSRGLNQILEDMKRQVLKSQARDFERRAGELRQYVSELRTVFRERGEVA
jgi:hypothetical protein